ncbi:MAG TPA: UDP-3-O-acyl-N-acetylglucosamine deacetylase [Candidatus Limnocylindria bacterium]|nr:UDP-3-O-acyl-N-acetylglucosamine deacetylase [Candidatus Limnocylindria bacterium]
MPQQQTLKQSIAFSGIGLHSGNKVQMMFHPAPANSGIRFRRTDLEGRPELEAKVDWVTDTQRSTTLAKGHLKIHTVEHVLAAFAGAGIHNAIIDLDAPEPPIADGSSREFARLIREAGTAVLPETVEPFSVRTPIELTAGESSMAIFPHSGFKVTCTSSDRQGRFTQYFSIEITPEVWEKELSHARTFCFYDEIEYLIKNGLIKGGSLENAIVIRDDAVLTNEPLRYREEFVRHKILDIIGDLSLVGRPINAHVIAMRPGHFANTELAKAIVAQMRKPLEAAQTFAPPPPAAIEKATEKAAEKKPVAKLLATPTPTLTNLAETVVKDGAVLDIIQVMQVLPHRPPFLMVDRVTKIDGNKITALKNVTVGESHFAGHFPDHPIMPGVLQLEAIAQVAGILMMRQAENAGKLAYFMSAEDVKWRKPVRPGDTLIIDVEMTKLRGKIGKAKGVCSVAGDTVSEANVTFMLMDR